MEKHSKPRETDAKINKTYMEMPSGKNSANDFDGDEHDACTIGAGATPVHMFPPARWDFSSQEEMLALMKFEMKTRVGLINEYIDLRKILRMFDELH